MVSTKIVDSYDDKLVALFKNHFLKDSNSLTDYFYIFDEYISLSNNIYHITMSKLQSILYGKEITLEKYKDNSSIEPQDEYKYTRLEIMGNESLVEGFNMDLSNYYNLKNQMDINIFLDEHNYPKTFLIEVAKKIYYYFGNKKEITLSYENDTEDPNEYYLTAFINTSDLSIEDATDKLMEFKLNWLLDQKDKYIRRLIINVT